MMINNPLISIIIPIYNAENYICDAINSVLSQTYKNWELILINDGSTDNTHEIIKPFLNQFKNIKYLSQTNSGVSKSRNRGIQESAGELIAFLDADDCWLPENLERKVRTLLNENYDFVFSDIYYTDEKLNITKTITGTDKDMLQHYLLWDCTVIPCLPSNVIIRQACIQNRLQFDENLSTAADQDFGMHLSKNYEGKRIQSPMVLYRNTSNSMSKNIKVMERDHIYVYLKAQKNKLFASLLFENKCFSNLYLILAGSWYVNGSNKIKGLYYIIKSIFLYPPNVLKLLRKVY